MIPGFPDSGQIPRARCRARTPTRLTTQNSTPLDAMGQLMVGFGGHLRLLPGTTERVPRSARRIRDGYEKPCQVGRAMREQRSQRFERSLDECRGRISALHAKLESCSPTGPVHSGWHPSGSARLDQLGPAFSTQDGPGVDAALSAIGNAAQRLLRGLERPGDASRQLTLPKMPQVVVTDRPRPVGK